MADDLSWQEILAIANATRGQRDNPLWFDYRKNVITASNFGAALRGWKFSSGSSSRQLDHIPAVRWGQENEQLALEQFQRESMPMLAEVESTGIFLHPTGKLGASPDGLVQHDNSIVEVKCPYRWRECNEIPLGSANCYLDSQGQLKVNCPYYDQVQGTMVMTGRRSHCHFIVWTPRQLHVTRVEYSAEWEREKVPLLLALHDSINWQHRADRGT